MSALLRKEWREHRAALLVLLLACLGAAMFELDMAADAVTPLQAWHGMAVRFGPLAAVYLANRLVMREYGAGTQLFLETLPLSRTMVILVKWCSGCLWLLLTMACAFGLILLSAHTLVPLDGRFAAAMGVRALVFLLLAYGLAFAVALTLRLRFFVWAILLGAAMLVDQIVQLPLQDWPPFYLVKPTMVLERVLPWSQLAITVVLALLAFGGALALALLARGALVTAFARRPSPRTRTVMILVLALAAWSITLLEPKIEPPPLKLSGAVVGVAGPRVEIGWRRDIAGVPAAQVAQTIARDLAALQAWLGLGRLDDTLLVADAWSRPEEFNLDHGGPGQVVLRAALGDPALSLEELKATVRSVQILDQAPAYRWHEDRYWLLAGLNAWWEARANPAYAALLERRAQAAAAWLRQHGSGIEAALRHSARNTELLGACLNTALDARAVQLLAARLGETGLRTLIRQALRAADDDLAGVLRTPRLERLLDEAGMPLSTLAARLEQSLAKPPVLTAPPRLTVRAVALEGRMAELHYRLLNRPPGNKVYLSYQIVQPGSLRLYPDQTTALPARDSGVLPATFVSGEQVLVIGQAWDAGLGCHVHFGAVRQELP